jgi:alkylhydroperoxidase family enzyme
MRNIREPLSLTTQDFRTEPSSDALCQLGIAVMFRRRLLRGCRISETGAVIIFHPRQSMAKFLAYTVATAPAASQPSLQQAERIFGVVPNLQAHLAESPETLSGYFTLLELFSKSTLSAVEQQVVSMTTNFENSCHYSMAGHSARALQVGIDQTLVVGLREGKPLADPKLEAVRRFTTHLVRERGFVAEADINAFLAAGYSRRNVLEVLLGVAAKILGNYTNHIVRTEYDDFMRGHEWSKPSVIDANAIPASVNK